MKIEDFQAFHEGIVGVMSFYGRDVSQFALDLWWNALKGYDLKAIVEAFNRWVVNPDAGQFPPKPADIVRLVSGSTQDRALSAWAKVDQAIRHVGTYESVVFDDPVIHRVLHDMGGWVSLGMKREDEWPFVAKEFENRYRGFAARGETPEYPPVLIGIAEAYNDSKGFKSTQPRLIGNPATAARVRGGGNAGQILQISRAGELASARVLSLVDDADASAGNGDEDAA